MEHEARLATGASRNFAFLLIIIFFVTFASSMVSASPVPFLVKDLAGTEETFVVLIGVLASVSSVAMITANFAGGFLADHVGRKRSIALGSGILVPSLFAYTIAPNAVWVIVPYFVQMFSVSLFQPAFTALVADMSGLSSRGKAFGRFNLFWLGASVPAPFVGGLLVDVAGIHFPFIIATLISIVGLIACFGLREISRSVKSASRISTEVDDEGAMMSFKSVMLVFGGIGLLTGLANGLLMPLNRLFPIDQLHVNATELGLAFSIGSGLVTTLVQVPGGRLTDRFGRRPIMLFSLLGAPFVVALAFTGSLSEFILATAGLVAFGNIAAPAYQAWQMELVRASKRAVAAGLINTLTGIGMFFGPFISIWLYQSQPIIAIAFVAAALPWVLQIPLILKLRETKALDMTS
jgi:DHA1 family multidrug resistance protein-like MFS transporter